MKDRKVGMENKESRRRMGTAERKAPSSSSRLSSVRDGAGGRGGKVARDPSSQKKMEIFHSKKPEIQRVRSRTERERSRKFL